MTLFCLTVCRQPAFLFSFFVTKHYFYCRYFLYSVGVSVRFHHSFSIKSVFQCGLVCLELLKKYNYLFFNPVKCWVSLVATCKVSFLKEFVGLWLILTTHFFSRQSPQYFCFIYFKFMFPPRTAVCLHRNIFSIVLHEVFTIILLCMLFLYSPCDWNSIDS